MVHFYKGELIHMQEMQVFQKFWLLSEKGSSLSPIGSKLFSFSVEFFQRTKPDLVGRKQEVTTFVYLV